MPLPIERANKYDFIKKHIGNTPLRKITQIEVPDGCRIYVKEEYKNPTGSHYDRQTFHLFEGKESSGQIIPSTSNLLETTTGSSGASFAWFSKILDYPQPVVMIPQDMPDARISQIKSYGAEIIFSEKEEYVTGLLSSVTKYLTEQRKDTENNIPNKYFLNHSCDEIHSPKGMVELGKEILADLDQYGEPPPDYVVVALGNGISALGIGKALSERNVKIYGMEPYESPTVTQYKFPEKYKKLEKMKSNQHIVIGTGAGQGSIVNKFPNLKVAAGYIEDTFLPKKDDVLKMKAQMHYKELILAGNSSAGCLWAALELAKQKKQEKPVIVTIMYDAAWRYLTLTK